VTIAQAKPILLHDTVRTVRTVRTHSPATACGAGDEPKATVRRPSEPASRPHAKHPCRPRVRLAVERERTGRPTRRGGFVGPSGGCCSCGRGGNGSQAGLFRSTARTQGNEGIQG